MTGGALGTSGQLTVAVRVLVPLLVVAVHVTLCVFVAIGADRRGRSGVGWGVLAFFITPMAAAHSDLVESLYGRPTRRRRMKTAVAIGVVVVGVLLLLTACPLDPAETYAVVYDANGATSGTAPRNQTKTLGVDLTLATNSGNLVRSGYSFAGWNTEADGNGTDYVPGSSYTEDADLTLYAKWLASTYAVFFDKQGGMGGSNGVVATFDSPMPAAIAPARTDLVFAGYYTDTGGTGTQYYTAAMASARAWDIPANTELVAHWTDSCQSVHIGTLRYVPGGTFQRDGISTNTTTVSPFFMSVHEITQAHYVAVTGKPNPSQFVIGAWHHRPVERVSWYDALVFCNMLSMAEGRTPVYTIDGSTDPDDWGPVPMGSYSVWNAAIMNLYADGYRLPTEAEWMWAAMGATSGHGYGGAGTYTTGYLKLFAGSDGENLVGDYAWFVSNSGVTTHAVGERYPNELGLYDVSGNAWEWVWDWHASYPPEHWTDPTGPPSGGLRVLRGGSWHAPASYCAVANRWTSDPSSQDYRYGFRVVRR